MMNLIAILICLFIGQPDPESRPSEGAKGGSYPDMPLEAASEGLAGQAGEVFISNEVGMSMTLPEGAVIATKQDGDDPFFVVRDGSESPTWSLRLESSPPDDPTAEAMIRRLMLSQDAGSGSSLKILDEQPFRQDEALGHLAWVEETLENGKKVIFGWLVLPQGRIRGQLRYIVATSITLPRHLPRVKPLINQSLESIAIRGPVLAGLNARVEADATKAILEQLDEATLRKLNGHVSYRRAYRPGPPGEADTEVAYSIFSITAAPMGAIQIRKNPDSYNTAEQEEGFLLRIHSRVIAEADREIYLDMLGLYWMSWDLEDEAWTATVTRRQGAATRTEKEFGFRSPPSLGEPRPRLMVIKQDDEINLREPYEWETPEPWMPRPLVGILGLFLPKSDPVAMSYAFFDHRNATPQLGSRRDEWSLGDQGESTWILRTWLDDSGLPAIAEYGSEGMIRQRNPDGLVIEATTPERITQIWDQAGLKTR